MIRLFLASARSIVELGDTVSPLVVVTLYKLGSGDYPVIRTHKKLVFVPAVDYLGTRNRLRL